MKQNKLTLAAFLILIALLPACGKQSFKIKNLQPLSKVSAQFVQIKDQVTVRAKKFTNEDAIESFGKNAPRLFNDSVKYQPVQLSITNSSNKAYRITDKSFNIKIVDPKTVFKVLRYSKAGTIAGYTALALTFAIPATVLIAFPFVLAAAFGRSPFFIEALYFIIPGLLLSSVAIASPFLGIRSASSKGELNDAIKRNMRATLLNEIEIEAQQTQDFVLFFEVADSLNQLSLTLNRQDPANRQLLFDIDFNKPAEFIKN